MLVALVAHTNAPTRGTSPDCAATQPSQWSSGQFQAQPGGPAGRVEALYITGWASCGRTDHQAQLVLYRHYSTAPHNRLQAHHAPSFLIIKSQISSS